MLQRDGLLNMWNSESSGGGQGSTRLHACREWVQVPYGWGLRLVAAEGFEKRVGPSRSCLFHLLSPTCQIDFSPSLYLQLDFFSFGLLQTHVGSHSLSVHFLPGRCDDILKIQLG